MKERTIMSVIKNLWWFFRLEKRRYLIGILALSLVSVLNLIPPKVMGHVIDHITNRNLNKEMLLWDLFYLLLSAFAMYGLRYVWRIYILGTSYRLGQIMRSRLFEHFTKMSPSFYQKYRTGDLMAHATNDINSLTRLAGGGVMSAVDASITALVTLMTMFFSISWQMTLVAIIPLPLMALATSRLGRKTHESFKRSQAAFSELNNKVQESVSGIKVTKSFGYQTNELASFQETNGMTFAKNMITMKYDSMFDPLVLLFVGASSALTLLVGAFFVKNGQVTVGSLVTFVTYLDMLVWPLMAIGFLFNIVQRGAVSYERIMDLLSQKSDITDPKHPLTKIENGSLEYDIDRFAYEKEATLKDVHFALKKGQTLGIVGQTGSGKTSLLKLLLREYDVNQGTIKLNGHDIRQYRLADLRSLIGYVPQDQVLFAMSILDNIRFGDPNLTFTAVEGATKLSQVYDDIVAMPQGFDTIIGEKGVSLSGGQKQRIAMSRAMILNPDILILDDSLSAVDAKTEHAIIENLKKTRQDKTTLITAHRLSAVVHADLILVMQDGHIQERGCHDELIQAGGWYAKTYESQQLEMKGEIDEE
ncbi:TPA: ABC transporter transmembrane domain-containing protein [Streptococcus mutans]|uniref:ABC transporter ATP-binding protein n=1 Tax=Streptococcus mutans TaxID=1309 RepID=UPI00037E1B2C|nr:ABC transporter transmembrane domain-containing protein [Streptococcus mutans]MCB5047402.1 ATP-binding cassette domain-containing protein [Streptococcus mutans]MDT9552492.1 ABC transporter transmembrane domain-containing protein [Streptococcus mutans]MDT9572433.1 ABC transporter transmembrane domain-containing protein [Streptococcus mutans]NLQ77640.1 ATP-binding cassette domain-containing protein [Streptococcus mutans]NLQ94808.1 ATP-binding cassette domain-containing protein [Streptococcus 